MEPFHSRLSYASWRLRVFQQLFLPSDCPIYTRNIHLTPNNTPNESSVSTTNNQSSSSSQNDATNEKINIPPSKLLPQSPLITNPNPGRAIRHRKKRPAVPSDLSELTQNPWAMALASPVRFCAVTGTRSPRALLTDWGLVEASSPSPAANPDSNLSPPPLPSKNPGKEGKEEEAKLWLLPIGLLQDELSPPAQKSADKSQPQATARDTPRLKVRMVDRLPILNTLTEHLELMRSRKRSPLARLIPFRWKSPHGPISAREEERLVWNGDMPDFVLGAMRRETRKKLKRASDTFKRQDVANGVWRSIHVGVIAEEGAEEGAEERALMLGLEKMEPFERMGSGVILVMGQNGLAPSEFRAEEGDGGDTACSLPDFVTLPLLNTKVPVFDLRKLFSCEELDEIRVYHARFQTFAVFLRPTDHLTVDAVLALWKLQGFLRED